MLLMMNMSDNYQSYFLETIKSSQNNEGSSAYQVFLFGEGTDNIKIGDSIKAES